MLVAFLPSLISVSTNHREFSRQIILLSLCILIYINLNCPFVFIHPTFPQVRREEVFLFSFLHVCTISSISYIFKIFRSKGSYQSVEGLRPVPSEKKKNIYIYRTKPLSLQHTLLSVLILFSPFIAKLLKKIVYIYWVHFFPSLMLLNPLWFKFYSSHFMEIPLGKAVQSLLVLNVKEILIS